MQPNLNHQLHNAIDAGEINSIRPLIQQGAQFNSNIFSSTNINEKAKKLLNIFYILFTPPERSPQNTQQLIKYIEQFTNYLEQHNELKTLLNDEDQDMLTKLLTYSQKIVQIVIQDNTIQKLEAWQKAWQEALAINATLRTLASLSAQPKQNLSLPSPLEGTSEDHQLVLHFAHYHHITNTYIEEPRKLCQGILKFYASLPNIPIWLKNITELSLIQQSNTADSLSCTATPTQEISVDIALGLCIDLIRYERELYHQGNIKPLHYAVLCNLNGITKLLLTQKNIDINEPDSELQLRTPLHLAIQQGNYERTQQLIHHGANINGNTGTYLLCPVEFISPLQLALQHRQVEIAKLLLTQKNIDVNRMDKQQRTALYEAITLGKIEIIKRLLDCKAQVNQADCNGSTPLHWAAKQGHKSIIKLLLDHGANRNAKDQDGKTPRDLAQQYSHHECTNLFLHPWIARTVSAITAAGKMLRAVLQSARIKLAKGVAYAAALWEQNRPRP